MDSDDDNGSRTESNIPEMIPNSAEKSMAKINEKGVRREIDYLRQHKLYPEEIPEAHIQHLDHTCFPVEIIPVETTRVECNANLSEPIRVTDRGKIIRRKKSVQFAVK